MSADRPGFLVMTEAAVPLAAGDVVVNFRGEPATFVGVERGPDSDGRSAKVVVERDGFRRAAYAQVYGLTVTPNGGEAA